MSARKPADVVQEAYAAFGRRDIPAIIAVLAQDVTWVVHAPQTIPYAGKRSGKAAVQGWFETLGQAIAVTRLDVERFIVQGDDVAAVGSFACSVNATGRSYATRFVHLWRVTDGRVSAYEDFFDSAAAAAAHSR